MIEIHGPTTRRDKFFVDNFYVDYAIFVLHLVTPYMHHSVGIVNQHSNIRTRMTSFDALKTSRTRFDLESVAILLN